MGWPVAARQGLGTVDQLLSGAGLVPTSMSPGCRRRATEHADRGPGVNARQARADLGVRAGVPDASGRRILLWGAVRSLAGDTPPRQQETRLLALPVATGRARHLLVGRPFKGGRFGL